MHVNGYKFLIMILTRKIAQNFSLQSGKLFIWSKDSSPKLIDLPE